MVFPCGEVLPGHKKEWDTDTGHNTDEPWKYTKWEKLITKGHILYDSINDKCLE